MKDKTRNTRGTDQELVYVSLVIVWVTTLLLMVFATGEVVITDLLGGF